MTPSLSSQEANVAQLRLHKPHAGHAGLASSSSSESLAPPTPATEDASEAAATSALAPAVSIRKFAYVTLLTRHGCVMAPVLQCVSSCSGRRQQCMPGPLPPAQPAVTW